MYGKEVLPVPSLLRKTSSSSSIYFPRQSQEGLSPRSPSTILAQDKQVEAKDSPLGVGTLKTWPSTTLYAKELTPPGMPCMTEPTDGTLTKIPLKPQSSSDLEPLNFNGSFIVSPLQD
jgi:hypothetical protein